MRTGKVNGVPGKWGNWMLRDGMRSGAPVSRNAKDGGAGVGAQKTRRRMHGTGGQEPASYKVAGLK